MEREAYILITILFVIYFVYLIWLFNYIPDAEINNVQISEKCTVIIHHENSIENLLDTINSISKQKYNLEKIKIIIFDSSIDDIYSILEGYNYYFKSIDIKKTNRINNKDNNHLLCLSPKELYGDDIIILRSSEIIKKHFIPKSIKILNGLNISGLIFPIYYRLLFKKDFLNQIFLALKTSYLCSSWNKNMLSHIDIYKDVLLIKKKYFIEIVDNQSSKDSFEFKYIMQKDMYCENINYPEINIIYFRMLTYMINFAFLLVIFMFISSPSIYFLFLILLKTFPETIYIYSFYNRLSIPFPKFYYLLYLFVFPFYLVIAFYKDSIIFLNR